MSTASRTSDDEGEARAGAFGRTEREAVTHAESRPLGICHGNGADHCCYVAGQVCPYLGENVQEGRRWSCTLLAELGTWSAVHQDERYLRDVAPAWEAAGIADCGLWWESGSCCYKDV